MLNSREIPARRPVVHTSYSLADSNQFDDSLAEAPGKAAQWGVAAVAMLASGQNEMATGLALKILKEAPDDPEAVMLASEVLGNDVPDWHFKMVQDHVRNTAYEAALRRVIRPGMRVLDIGSGTGLLAMMAARAGAEQVFSCEMNPVVADAAREIVAANGFSDRIQVLAKHSDQLDAEADLGGRVDVIVSEIVSRNLLGEGVLSTMEHAVENLLKPGGQVIPAKGTVKIALGFDANRSDERMGTACGFDLAIFNRLAKPTYSLSTRNKHLQLMSDAAELFEFDFQAIAPGHRARTELKLISRGGPVNCIVQWIHLQIDEAAHYENRPGGPDYAHWAVAVWPLPKEAMLEAGDVVRVYGSHDLNNVRIWTRMWAAAE